MFLCFFVCLFVFFQFVSIVTYPGNKLRGNRDCEVIIRRGGGGVKTGRGTVSKLFSANGGGHIIFNNNLSHAQQYLNSILRFCNCHTLLKI